MDIVSAVLYSLCVSLKKYRERDRPRKRSNGPAGKIWQFIRIKYSIKCFKICRSPGWHPFSLAFEHAWQVAWVGQTDCLWALCRCVPHCIDFLCLPVCPNTQSPQLLTFFCLFLLLLTCLEWRGDSGSCAILSFVWAPKTEATEMRRLVLRLKLPDSEQNFTKVFPLPSQGQFLGTWRILRSPPDSWWFL